MHHVQIALRIVAFVLVPLPLLSQSIQVGTASQTILATNAPTVGNAPSTSRPISDSMVSPTATIVAANIDTSDLLRGGDTLIIRLTGVPTQDQGIFEVKIDESGKISMPHIGSLVAANNTTVELKKLIESTYLKEEIFTNPNVTVDLKEQRFVDVTGEVRMPQRVPYTKDLTALGAVAACGGFTDFANRRRVRLTQGGQTQEFNAKEIQADQGRDIRLKPNDKIQVDRSIF
ncbi:MAG: polysaccharide biosynthesis/export family protein [Candidatus Pacebacteria bacterium]|nr:polysaccharide biosynthesis/export family protein [Candidatus Paceibacterota bacterium]